MTKKETYDIKKDIERKRELITDILHKRAKHLDDVAWVKSTFIKETLILQQCADNPRYNIPRMLFIKDDEYQLLEARAHGQHLTHELFSQVSRRQRYEIIDGIAAFLVDMNELKPVQDLQKHKIASELKFDRLDNFVTNKMSKWFTNDEVKYMSKICDQIGTFEYDTRPAWSHCDLNSGNVLYDPETSTLSFIDFAEAGYHFIYRDIFAPLQIELRIFRPVYETYCKLHSNSEYIMPSIQNPALREIMKYRIMVALLKRFIKASDDLRSNPASQKSIKNNEDKIAFMREQIKYITELEQQFKK